MRRIIGFQALKHKTADLPVEGCRFDTISMAMTKSERRRSAATRARNLAAARSDSLADVAGIAAGSYLSGRYTSGKTAGPLTQNQWLGLLGTALKIFGPVRRNPIMSGASTAAVSMGGTDLFALGLKHRAESILPGNGNGG